MATGRNAKNLEFHEKCRRIWRPVSGLRRQPAAEDFYQINNQNAHVIARTRSQAYFQLGGAELQNRSLTALMARNKRDDGTSFYDMKNKQQGCPTSLIISFL